MGHCGGGVRSLLCLWLERRRALGLDRAGLSRRAGVDNAPSARSRAEDGRHWFPPAYRQRKGILRIEDRLAWARPRQGERSIPNHYRPDVRSIAGRRAALFRGLAAELSGVEGASRYQIAHVLREN